MRALKRGLSYAFGVVRGPKGAPFRIKTPSKKDQHLYILHSVTLKFQGPVPQNFLKSILKFLPKLTFTNLKYTR